MPGLSRRGFLRAVSAGAGASALASVLSACGDQLYTSGELVIASPDHPVRWPLSTKHPRIEPGQRPRPGSTLRL
jgi:hypothetical protein